LQLATQQIRQLTTNYSDVSYPSNMHDRYIETDKLRIILTSGLDYLENQRKDFTYIVKEK